MKKYLKSLPWAYVLFRFYLLAFNSTIQKAIVIGVIGYYVHNNYIRTINRKIRGQYEYSILILGLFILWTVIVPILHRTLEFSFSRKMLSKMFDLLCWTAFIIHVKKVSSGRGTLFALADEYGRIIVLYVLFTVVCLILPSLKNAWISTVAFTESERSLLSSISGYAGRVGWDGFAGYTATFMCSLSVLFCCTYLFSDERDQQGREHNFAIYFYLVVAILGNFLYGRVGTITSAAVLFAYIAMNMLRVNKWKHFLTMLCAALGVGVLIAVLRNRNEVIANIYKWAFEPVINYFAGRGFTTTSSTRLFEMYFRPSLKTVLLGDGYYTAANGINYYMSTDAGLLRLVLYWGILPTILLYLYTLRSFSNALWKDHMLYPFLVFALFEFKGEICLHMLVIFTAIGLLSTDLGKKRKRLVVRI